MNDVTIALLVFYSLACGIFTCFVAETKNRDGAGWLLLGLVFGIFALIGIAGSVPYIEKPKSV